MKIVFIAGAYMGGEENRNRESIERNIREAEKYQVALGDAGVGFFCPHNHTEHFEEKSTAPEEFYRKLDRTVLERACDGILVVSGWESSEGTKLEIEWAKENDVPIFFPKSPADLSEVINWAKD